MLFTSVKYLRSQASYVNLPWSRMMKIFGLGQMDQNGIFGIGIEMNLTMLEAEIEKEFS